MKLNKNIGIVYKVQGGACVAQRLSNGLPRNEVGTEILI